MANPGAVFFLGSRAHYHILDQPETRQADVDNGNLPASVVTSSPDISWTSSDTVNDELNDNHQYYDSVVETTGLTRRRKLQTEEVSDDYEYMRDQSDPSYSSESLRSVDESKRNSGCVSLRNLYDSLRGMSQQRKRRYGSDDVALLDNINSHLFVCTYKDSCKCIECQIHYFDCDEDSDSSENYDSDLDEYFNFTSFNQEEMEKMLKASKYNKNAENVKPELIELAAGTPVVLDYILHHPVMCSIQ